MSLLALPQEIKHQIYQYIFSELIISIATDDDLRFEKAEPHIVYRPDDISIDSLRPFNVPLVAVCKTFRKDEHLLRTIFQNCILRLQFRRQLSTFEDFLNHSPVLTIFGDQLPFQHLLTSRPVLHNIERSQQIRNGKFLKEIKSLSVMLDVNTTMSSYEYVALFPYAESEIIPCTECEPPVKPCPQGHAEGDYRCHTIGRVYCDEHVRAHPKIFANPKASARRSFTTHDRGITSNFYHKPEEFILMNFFNDLSPRARSGFGDSWNTSCIFANKTKVAIMQQKMHVRVLCRISFVDQFKKTIHIVDAEFDTRDWLLSYVWEGDRYEIPQIKPALRSKDRGKKHEIIKFVAASEESSPAA